MPDNLDAPDGLRKRIKDLEDLVNHCWVHSGYPDCGYQQMDSEMRTLYDAVKMLPDDESQPPTCHSPEHPQGCEPITEEWFRSIGALPDGEAYPTELAIRIWSLGDTESDGSEPAMQVVWSTRDGSCWLETYGAGGETMCLVELRKRNTRGEMMSLLAELGGWQKLRPASDVEVQIEATRLAAQAVDDKAVLDSIAATLHGWPTNHRNTYRPYSLPAMVAAALAQVATLASQLEAIQGALADAGTVLAERQDGDYAASVRELVRQKEKLREALEKIDARCCEASSRVPAIGLLSGPERALCDVHTIARDSLDGLTSTPASWQGVPGGT